MVYGLAATFFCLNGQAQQLNIRTYGVTDGLPQSQPLSLFQDRSGHLWVATYAGISRFNGMDWKTYSRRQGLPTTRITCIAQDAEGHMIAGFEFEGLWRLEQDQWRRDSILGTPGMAPNRMILHDGSLWISTGAGLFRRTNGVVTDENARLGSFSGSPVFHIVRHQDDMWVTTDKGTLHISGNRVRQVVQEKTHYIGQMLEVSIVAATKNALHLDVMGQNRQVPYPIEGIEINDGATDQNGYVWLATRNHGLLGWDGSDWRVITTENGASSDHINTVLPDRDGNIWMANYDSLDRYSPGPFQVFTDREGLAHPFVRALYLDRKQTLWAGTRQGVSLWDGQRFESLPTEFLEDSRIYGLTQDQQGRMFFATGSGLTVFNGEHSTHFDMESGLPEHFLQTVFTDRQDRVWLGCRGLYRWREGEIATIIASDDLAGSVVTMMQDKTDRIWVGTSRGPMIIDQEAGTQEFFKQVPAIIWCLDEDREGRIWMATNGLGLVVYDAGEFHFIDRDNGMPDDYYWQVLCVDGSVWTAHNHGLSRLYQDRWEHFNLDDGIADMEGTATAIIHDSDQRIWFGSSKGLTRYAPDESRLRPLPPSVSVDQIRTPQRAIQPGERIARAINQIEIHFSSVQLTHGAQYRYRLLGFNETWSELTSNRRVTYASLAPGKYQFEVVAESKDQSQSQIARFPFGVARAFWETSLFRLLLTAVLLLGIFAYTRWRVQIVQKRKAELEREVRTRTDSLRQTNTELIQLQTKLVEEAHNAGLAEAAREVLHVVGNTLNSFRVSLDTLDQTLEVEREEMILRDLENHPATPEDMLRAVSRIVDIRKSRITTSRRDVADLKRAVGQFERLLLEQQRHSKAPPITERVNIEKEIRYLVEVELKQIGDYAGQTHIKVDLPQREIDLPRLPLIRVLRELLRNAETAVRDMDARSKRIDVDVFSASDYIHFRIRDNGHGLTSDELAHVFEYGYSGNPSSLGAGLHSAANIIQNLGGVIELTSPGPGRGACCTIGLPHVNPAVVGDTVVSK